MRESRPSDDAVLRAGRAHRRLARGLVAWSPYLLVFLASLHPPWDPDLGWHLRYGEYFFHHGGVLRENILSSDLPDYRWINVSWGTDLLTYVLYRPLGLFGLSIATAIAIVSTFLVFSKWARLTFRQQLLLFPLLLFVEDTFLSPSFRGQIVSLLFTGLLCWLERELWEGNRGSVWLTALLIAIWSNIHGQYVMGIGIVFSLHLFRLATTLLTCPRSLPPRLASFALYSLAFAAGSVLGAAVHPFGFGVLRVVYRLFSDPMVKYVTEWAPPAWGSTLGWSLVAWGLLLILGVKIHARRGNLREVLPYAALCFALWLFSFYSSRLAMPLFFLTLPAVSAAVPAGSPSKLWRAFCAAPLVFGFLFVILVKIPREEVWNLTWVRVAIRYLRVTPASARFLVSQHFPGRMMTYYDWGGWLIWNYPDIMPSIDGRMTLWRDETGRSAYQQHLRLVYAMDDIDRSGYDLVYVPSDAAVVARLRALASAGEWRLAYTDPLAVIYIRTQTSRAAPTSPPS